LDLSSDSVKILLQGKQPQLPARSETPGSAALLPDGTYLYVIRSNTGRINLIDAQTQTRVGGGFTVAPSPNGIAIDPNGERAYIAYDGNKVKVIKITE
jgi:DNA-binding beta-propeller fold protein YncE